MRIRITRTPPPTYGIDGDSLLVGRVYDLDASLAAALMIEGCAESYDLLTPTEKREFRSRKPAKSAGSMMSNKGADLMFAPSYQAKGLAIT